MEDPNTSTDTIGYDTFVYSYEYADEPYITMTDSEETVNPMMCGT